MMARNAKRMVIVFLLLVVGVLLVRFLSTGTHSEQIDHYDSLAKPPEKMKTSTKNKLINLLKCMPFSAPPTDVTVEGQTCEQFVRDEIVIAGAASANHFEEVKDMIASVQHFYPKLRIIIHDLGLTPPQVKVLETYCNVQVRLFNFTKYPDFVNLHVHTYSWKPLMALELSKEFDFFFYFDCSIRLMKPHLDIAVPLMAKFPFIAGGRWTSRYTGSDTIVGTTHDGMIKYFNITQSREELHKFGLVESGYWGVMVNDLSKSKILEPWADCALHKECIAPEGAHSMPCDSLPRSDPKWAKGTFRGCHRFDQSALDMVLYRGFGVDILDLFLNSLSLIVERWPTHRYTVKNCSQLIE